MEYVVLVNEHNEQIGVMPKIEAHGVATPLHRAFSLYIFNKDGKFLLTQRALKKKVFPGIWTNSCCGHPGPDEKVEDAIKRRLVFELGLLPKNLTLVISNYRYRAVMDGIVENEICPVYVAKVLKNPTPNPDEVEDYKWIAWEEYLTILEEKPEDYSPWCIEQTKLLIKDKIFLHFCYTIHHTI